MTGAWSSKFWRESGSPQEFLKTAHVSPVKGPVIRIDLKVSHFGSQMPGYAHQSAPPKSKGTYAFVSLGCPKNLVDSERMLGLLKIDGYELVSEPDGADFVVVNTCGFIERAR